MIDKKSSIDVMSRLEKAQARKLLGEFFKKNPNNTSFTKHAREQMVERLPLFLRLTVQIRLRSSLHGEMYDLFNVWLEDETQQRQQVSLHNVWTIKSVS